jgi:hypothetical protein
MMAQCPYCGGKMGDPPVTAKMSHKQQRVYHAIVNAGPEGVQSQALMTVLFDGNSPNTLRSCVYYINKAISPMTIKSRNKSYFISER